MKDAERQQVLQQLRADTDAILRGGTRLPRDVDVLNRLDNLMAKADTPRENNPAPDENH